MIFKKNLLGHDSRLNFNDFWMNNKIIFFNNNGEIDKEATKYLNLGLVMEAESLLVWFKI